MIAFLHQHGAEIGRLTFEHLWLTLFAMLLATGIGCLGRSAHTL